MANILLDTGPLVALLNQDENLHEVCVDFLKSCKGRFLSTEPVVTETLYLLGDSFAHQKKCIEFILKIVEIFPFSPSSLKRSLVLMEKYKDIPMDYADATLVVLAEEVQTGKIFTLDRRGFTTYRWDHHRAFEIFP